MLFRCCTRPKPTTRDEASQTTQCHPNPNRTQPESHRKDKIRVQNESRADDLGSGPPALNWTAAKTEPKPAPHKHSAPADRGRAAQRASSPAKGQKQGSPERASLQPQREEPSRKGSSTQKRKDQNTNGNVPKQCRAQRVAAPLT